MAINPTPRQLSLLKSLIFLLALIPFARMVWLTYSGQLVEPLEFITRGTCDWTLYFLCISLAVTSTNGMVKRLGGKRWQWLHRLIYVIAPLGILHFWWMKAGKHNFAQPILFGVIVALLLAIRVFFAWSKRAKSARAAAAATPARQA